MKKPIVRLVVGLLLWTVLGELTLSLPVSASNGTGTMEINSMLSAPLSTTYAAVTAGGSHTCALTTGGGIKCWGYNNYGQLGDGTTTNRNTPMDVSGLASGVIKITAGYNHTCALTTGGGVKCWGSNSAGQLGNGEFGYSTIPVDLVSYTSLYLPLILR